MDVPDNAYADGRIADEGIRRLRAARDRDQPFFLALGFVKPHLPFTGQPVQTVDIYPTLVELAGLPEPEVPQPIDGLSLVPVLKDPSKRIRDHVVHAYPRKERMGRAIRTERYRLVEWNVPGNPADSADIELYDYHEDPLESKNLATARPDIVKELLITLNQYPLKE